MTENVPSIAAAEPTYRSGAVARLTRIPVATLRVWERRYAVSRSRLSPSGHRLYSLQDVTRLALIKQLVDRGSPIGSIARLSVEALRQMLGAADMASQDALPGPRRKWRPVRVAVVGEALSVRVARHLGQLASLDVVGSCADAGRAAEVLAGVSADVLLIELPALQPGALQLVDTVMKAVGAKHAVVLYRFGPEALVRALRERGHRVALEPIATDELERLCRAEESDAGPSGYVGVAPLPLDAVPPRRFDDRTLAELLDASTALYCECPRHVAELLLSLGNFEAYSAECENRSPTDAELHRYLKRVAGSARALFEQALLRLVQVDGLSLTDGPRPFPATSQTVR